MLRVAIVALLLAGCASPGAPGGHSVERWSFTQRSSAEDVTDIGTAEGFSVTIGLDAREGMRQIGGQWHAPLAASEPFTLRFDASADMVVEWRIKSGEAGASGRCEWGPAGAEKEVSLGVARMTNTTRSCEVVFTPHVELRDPDEPTLRWEARSHEAQPGGWTLTFKASR